MSSSRRQPKADSKPTTSAPAATATAGAASTGASTAPAASMAAPPVPVRIKQEPGTGAAKSERLPSYREQRDLTLGGLAPGRSSRSTANKKVFVPNLNVARNKNADVITSRDTSATGRGGRGGGRGKSERGRGGAGGKPSTLVQTSGLFSEGTGEAKLRKSSSVFDRNAGAGDSASQMRRPTLVKRESKVDQEAERKSIQDVLGTMMDDDEHDQLGGAARSSANGAAAAPAGGVAATGSADSDLFSPIALQETRSAQLQRTLRYPDTLDELFASVEQQLFVMQLPDTLPGHGPDVEPAESAEAECHAADEAKLNPLASFCTAQQLDDGLVGRVVRRRSGKIQMLLGDVVYNLSVGIDPGWLQEVMSVQTTDADRRHGSLTNLGQIGAKLNVTPDWERLFAARTAEARAVAKHVGSNGGGGEYM